MKGRIDCRLKRVISDRGSGFIVAEYSLQKAIPNPYKKGTTLSSVQIVGMELPVFRGVTYTITGEWQQNAAYGVQLKYVEHEVKIAENRIAVVTFLSCGLIPYIGRQRAEVICGHFKVDSLDEFESILDRLHEVKGISPAMAEKISNAYMEHKCKGDIIALLRPFNISTKLVDRVFQRHGSKTKEVITSNPYQLYDIPGIGFKKADDIAKKLELDLQSSIRVKAAIEYQLKQLEQQGHLASKYNDLIISTYENYLQSSKLKPAHVKSCIEKMVAEGTLVKYKDCIYLKLTALAEQDISFRIWEMLQFNSIHNEVDLDNEILKAEEHYNAQLAPEQIEAVKLGLTSPLCVITGGPGTGKTTILRFILYILKQLQKNVNTVLAAPTGMAARKMQQATGIEAETLHKALNFFETFDSQPSSVEDADVVVVDESSMMDIFIARRLFNKMPRGCRLILLGDEDQLPSVGPGLVLGDIIRSGKVPVVRLKRIYRQEEGSLISHNAALINKGETKLVYDDESFRFVEAKKDVSAEVMTDLYVNAVKENGSFDDILMVSPKRTKLPNSADTLNAMVQKALNPPDKTKAQVRRKQTYRVGDKVMHRKNLYRDGVALSNGDIGRITRIYKADGIVKIAVSFSDDRQFQYTYDDLDMLELAYCTTVHKAQGSEFKEVIINVQHNLWTLLLRRNMYYTAITRASKKLTLVGQKAALTKAIRNNDTDKRHTNLSDRIKRLLKKAA